MTASKPIPTSSQLTLTHAHHVAAGIRAICATNQIRPKQDPCTDGKTLGHVMSPRWKADATLSSFHFVKTHMIQRDEN